MTSKKKPVAKAAVEVVLCTVTKANGEVMEIVAGGGEESTKCLNEKIPPLKKQRVNRGVVLKGLPTEAVSFLQDVPVFENGKLVGFLEEERKTAAVVGRISASKLDLRRFQKDAKQAQ